MAGLLGLSGLGVAAFHPEAARQARRAAGSRAATGMSVFGVGGGLGFALAPPLTAGLFALAGRPGLLAAGPAAVLVAALLAWRLPPARPGAHVAGLHRAGADDWGAFTLLGLVTVARSVVFVGLNTFLALYWMERYGATPSGGAAVLGLFLGAGLTGTLLGGWLGDRVGHRAAIRTGFLVAVGLLPAVLLAPSAGWAAVLLVPLAVAFSVPGSVLVVLGQEYLPGRVGVASGVTLGLSVSVGGMAAPLLGWAADRHGTGAVLVILEGVLAAAAGLSLLLPRPGTSGLRPSTLR
jgi:FSR family fosmidomycin resistance protein-like MFS transporter